MENFTLTLRLKTNENDIRWLNKVFFCSNRIYNIGVKEARKRLNKYKEDQIVNELSKKYRSKEGLSKADWKILNNKQKEYEINNKYCLEKYVKLGRLKYSKWVHSTVAANIADTVYNSISKYLKDNGKEVHYKKYKDLKTISAKTIEGCVLYNEDTMTIEYLKHKFKIYIKHNDSYVKECLNNKVKFCRIKRKWHKHQYRYYVEFVLEGIPPLKRKYSSGVAGVDLGTSTIAVSSKNKLIFTELNDGINSIDEEIKKLNRKADRQRRANNPQNYNENGAIRRNSKNFKRKWIISNSNKKTYDEIKALYQKRSNQLKQFHHLLSNEIVECGDYIKIENMDYQALAKKSKKTEISAKTGKYKKKKRFGNSIQIHAPAQLINLVRMKLHYVGGIVETVNNYKIRASQFNHLTGEYLEVKLNDRWKTLLPNIEVQRDLYSAFLIEHVEDKNNYNYETLSEDFKTFKQQHYILINELIKQKQEGNVFPSCMGI